MDVPIHGPLCLSVLPFRSLRGRQCLCEGGAGLLLGLEVSLPGATALGLAKQFPGNWLLPG